MKPTESIPKQRPWLLEHLPGGVDSRGQTLFDPPKWSACDLTKVQPMEMSLKLDFESTEPDCNDVPRWYYKDFATAATRLLLVRSLITAKEARFRIRHAKTDETIYPEELEGLVLRRRARVRRGETVPTESEWTYGHRDRTADGDSHAARTTGLDNLPPA